MHVKKPTHLESIVDDEEEDLDEEGKDGEETPEGKDDGITAHSSAINESTSNL